MNLLYNPNLMLIPAKLYSRHPAQDEQPLSQFLSRTKFYYAMCAFIEGHEKDFNKINTQDILVHNLDHGDTIIAEIELERKSHNKEL